jgi:hypothetical protein
VGVLPDGADESLLMWIAVGMLFGSHEGRVTELNPTMEGFWLLQCTEALISAEADVALQVAEAIAAIQSTEAAGAFCALESTKALA